MDARYGFRTVNMNLDKQFTKAKKSKSGRIIAFYLID
jgi:hypothetical protein